MNSWRNQTLCPPNQFHARRRLRWRSREARQLLLAYLLVAPVVVWRLNTSIYPFLYTVYISLHDSSLVRRTFTFVGATNYVAVWNDINVRQSVGFTIFFTAISVSLQLM